MKGDTPLVMNNARWFGIGIVVIVLISVAYFIGQGSNNQTQSTTPFTTATSQQPTSASTESQGASPQGATPATSAPKSLSDIIAEWRKSAADIECEWGNPNLGNYTRVSGSGLLVTLNSQPTVVTNRHVVDYPTSGSLDGCTIKFPDDSWSYFITSSQNISYDSNNYDVAYLTFPADQTQFMTQDVQNGFYSLSLDARSRNDDYVCKNPLAIGDPVVIMGYPAYGGSNAIFSANNGENPISVEVTATEGIISGKSGIYYTTSAKIDSGNSGGLAIDQTNDCYFGIPTWDESGNFESLWRILPVSTFLHY